MKPRPLIEYGVASLTFPGELQSGDDYLVKEWPGGALVAVVDGVGHGQEAAAAARAAVAEFERQPEAALDHLVKLCHERLSGTRGAVITLASFRPGDSTMAWIGVGNAEALLRRASPNNGRVDEALILRRGIAGVRVPPVSVSVLSIAEGDTLVVATDGIRSGFRDGIGRNASPQEIAERILAGYATKRDDALVLAVRYLGRRP